MITEALPKGSHKSGSSKTTRTSTSTFPWLAMSAILCCLLWIPAVATFSTTIPLRISFHLNAREANNNKPKSNTRISAAASVSNENFQEQDNDKQRIRKRDVLKNLISFRKDPSQTKRKRPKENDTKTPTVDEAPVTINCRRGSVFQESKTMLTLSDMVYSFVALRAHARTTKDQALQEELTVPQVSSILTPAILKNIHLLKKGKSFESDFIERAIQTVNQAEFRTNSNENSEVVYLGDGPDDVKQSCVYGIGVNRSEKRITVWFRGTANDAGSGTMNHWSKNFDTTLRLEEAPFDDASAPVPTYHLHRGFVRALLGRRRNILRRILEYQEEHPETKDFSLFVSGHSLGGALATLFGFYACQMPEFSKDRPVRVYTFAAPPVGDRAFGKYFRQLEKDGKIRLARIHNADDPVPHTFALTRYTHVGLGIELDFPQCEIQQEDRSSFFGKLYTIPRGKSAHKLSKSYEYLNRHAKGFNNSTLDELYESELGIVTESSSDTSKSKSSKSKSVN